MGIRAFEVFSIGSSMKDAGDELDNEASVTLEGSDGARISVDIGGEVTGTFTGTVIAKRLVEESSEFEKEGVVVEIVLSRFSTDQAPMGINALTNQLISTGDITRVSPS